MRIRRLSLKLLREIKLLFLIMKEKLSHKPFKFLQYRGLLSFIIPFDAALFILR